jgi:uncharacterized membrane protein
MAPLPAGRAYNAVIADQNGYVYVIGGTSDAGGSTPTNTNYRYHTVTDVWDAMAPVPTTMAAINGIEIAGRIYIPGDGNTATTYVYDIAADTWSTIPANGGYTARGHYQVVAIGPDLYVLGGVVSGASTTQVWKLNTATEIWTVGEPMQNERISFSAAASQGEIYVAGGVAFPGFAPDMTAEKFDGTSWSYIAAVPDGGGAYTRWSYNAAGHGADGLWLAAGRRDANWNVLNHAAYYNPDTDTWTDSPDVPTLAQGRVYMGGAVAADGYFYVIGGRNSAASAIYDTNERLYVGSPLIGDVFWLTQDPESGMVAAHDNLDVQITFTAFPTMSLGIYTATLRFSNSTVYGPLDVPVTMRLIDRRYGLELTPATDTATADPGQSVTYTLAITNTGNYTDTFNLALANHSWPGQLTTDSVTLAAAESTTFMVTVEVPPDASGQDSDMVTVTATAAGDADISAEGELTTTANPVYGIELSAATTAQSGLPGTVVTYTLTISNAGNSTDSFSFDASGNDWVVGLPLTVTLAREASVDVAVTVTIPADATGGAVDVATVSATSVNDPSATAAFDLTTLTTTADNVYGVELSPATAAQAGLPGEIVTYTLSIANTGNITDAIRFTGAGHNWTVGLPEPVALGMGESVDVAVTVAIQADAARGTVDTVIVTATSTGDGAISATSALTTTAAGPALTYLPLVMNRAVFLPDLIIEDMQLDNNDVTLVIANIGTSAVMDPFWVDVYFDPDPPPTAVNQTWPMLAAEGLVWGIDMSDLPAYQSGRVVNKMAAFFAIRPFLR